MSVGIGDDAAVIGLNGGRDLLACCDLMVEGVHFQTDWAPARLIGRKALAINLSDIAAMGGVPKFAMMSVAIPHTCSSGFIDELFDGVLELADETGVSIVGGDTSTSRDSLFIDVSVLGECEEGKAVTRAGARPGDVVYVTGALGASAVGLRLLSEGFRLNEAARKDPRQQCIAKHLSPEPRLKVGSALGQSSLASAMIDISDGLSTDLWHILEESHCGAVIDASEIPIADSVRSLGDEAPRVDPLTLALSSGEEYELLFTARPENQQRISTISRECGVEITRIGIIVEGDSLQLKRDGSFSPIEPSGYEHFI